MRFFDFNRCSGLLLTSIFFVVLLIYANSVNNEFVWDDNTIILRNEKIKDIDNFWDIVFAEDTTEDMDHTGFYRPLVYFSYAVDYYLWGYNPAGFRLRNIFFHFISAIIIYHVCFRLFKDDMVALTASILFVTHPVHVEPVSFIAARGSELGGFYYLLSLFYFIKHRQRKAAISVKEHLYDKYLLISSVAFIISLMAKEFAITMFIVMGSYDIVYSDDFKLKGCKKSGLTYVPYIVLTIAYLLARKAATRGAHGIVVLAGKMFGADILLRIVDAVLIVLKYISILILPAGQSVEYEFSQTTSLFSLNTLIAVSVLALVAFTLNRLRRTNRPVFISFVLFIAPLLLVLGIIPIKGEAYLADRWLYISAAGFFMMAAYYLVTLFNKIGGTNKRVLILNVVVTGALFFSYKTVLRNRVFKNELTLWSDTVKKSPGSFKVHLNHGYALYKAGSHDEALEEYKRALKIEPGSSKAKYNIAVYYQNKGDYLRAIEGYEKTLVSGASFYEVNLNIAECYLLTGNNIDALLNYKIVLETDPDSPNALKALSGIYSDLGDEARAKEYKARYDALNAAE